MKLKIKVYTNAKKNDIKKIDDNYYKIMTTAIPEDNKANKAIIELLAKFFHIGKSNIKIIKGLCCKDKIIEINDI